MKTSRISAAVVATLALFAAGYAHAEGAAGTGGTVRLDTVQKLWVAGDALGPMQNGAPRIGKNTGAGVMDANFTWDRTSSALAKKDTEVTLLTTYTRSSLTPNNNNSYMQGGFAIATISADATKGVSLGQAIDLPQLNGERAYMRPLIQATNKYYVLISASEDNESNNGNPKPVMYLVSKDNPTAGPVKIANNPRNVNKPIDLMRAAVRQGINVQNENNQRGPHMIVPVSDNSFIVGMQYNNQAQEGFRVTIDDSGATPSVQMNWVKRFSNNAVHNRPQVSYTPGAQTAFLTAIECNAQPANIGLRLTELNIDTGNPVQSKIVVRAIPNQNKYVAEPSIADLGDKVALGFAFTAKARDRNGNNGHASNGANVSQLAVFSKSGLTQVGEILAAPANYQRHAHIFGTTYGPNGDMAVGVISGSSTGTAKGLLQVIPVKADGTLGEKDPLKMYTVSTYSDVANLQVRGKRNPNNQAKGFINGEGGVPNPGFGKTGGFYPEVKTFSLSTVTGYSSDEARTTGKRESLWLSLVPATWQEGLQTTPGVPSDSAGTGPAPRTSDPATDPGPGSSTGNGGDVYDGTEATHPGDDDGSGARPALGADNGGCSVSHQGSSSSTAAILGLALAGALVIRRRKSEEV